jgi:hypothetical protein
MKLCMMLCGREGYAQSSLLTDSLMKGTSTETVVLYNASVRLLPGERSPVLPWALGMVGPEPVRPLWGREESLLLPEVFPLFPGIPTGSLVAMAPMNRRSTHSALESEHASHRLNIYIAMSPLIHV